MRILLGLLLFFATLLAESSEYSDTPEVVQKVLYLNYAEQPERVYKGQIFTVTYKTLSTVEYFEDILYSFQQGRGVKVLNSEPERRTEGHYYYDTFYFLSTSRSLRLPNVTASIKFSDFHDDHSVTLAGKKIEVVTLNPTPGFSNLLAKSVEITNYKTTRYNQKYNIAVFSLRAEHSNIEAFSLKNAVEQGIESVVNDHNISTITYYAVIPKKLENLTFTYFELGSEKFRHLLMPIIVEDDSVSTQSDLKPIERKHTQIKISIAAGVAFVGLVLLLLRRKLLYLLLVVIPGIYIAYAAIPVQYACIKEGSQIYLLPMERGTVFETTTQRQTLEVHGNVNDYVKVKLLNDQIGWIKNEDLCTP